MQWPRMAILAGAIMGVLLALPASAMAERDYSVRFFANAQGDITGTGNTLMTCDERQSAQCVPARSRLATPAANNNNNNLAMRWVDVDDDPDTFNSSAATLTLRPGARVLFAGLYYTGHSRAGTNGGHDAPDLDALDRVLLRPPGADAYVPLQATQIDEAGREADGSPREYQGFVPVTDLVQAAGPGEYTVANVQLATGLDDDMAGGWALAVAYEDSSQPTRNLTIFDGFRFVLADGPPVIIPLEGFLTPPAGPVATHVGLVAVEGDYGTAGDSATLNGQRLANDNNPDTNFFNASITHRSGAPFELRRPDYLNQLGFDADIVDATGFLANGQTSTTMVLGTSGDGFVTNGVSFATDLYAASLTVPKEVDKEEADLGEVLTYTLPVRNDGLDAALDTTVTDAIPGGTSFVEGSLRIDGVVQTDDEGDDDAEHSANQAVFRLGRLDIGETRTVSFQVRIDEEGLPVDAEIVNSARVGFTSLTTGEPGAVTSPDAVTRVRVPDLAIEKSFEGDFEAGARVPFTLRVSNESREATARGRTTVTDTLPPELRFAGTPQGDGWECETDGRTLTCTRDDELEPGDSWPPIRFTAVVSPTARPGELVNTARVSNPRDGNELNDEDSAAGSVTLPDLAIDKRTLTPVVFPGDAVRFRIVVTNRGPARATRVRVRDFLPAGLTPVSLIGSDGTTCGLRSCRLGTVLPGERVTIEVTALAGLDTGGRILRNVATVRGRQREVNLRNNIDSARVLVRRLVDLVVTKDAAAPSVPAGSDVSFTITVRNEGPSTATRVRLRDVLPDGLTLVSMTPTQGRCTGTDCFLGTLARGGAAQIEVVARSSPALAGQTLVNRAVAATRERERDLANNIGRAPVTFTAEPPPPAADIVVTKTADRQQVTVGDIVGFHVTVVNRGPGDAANVHLTDTTNAAADILSIRPSQGTCTTRVPVTCDLGPLAAGARATIDARVQVLAPGPLRNTVTSIAPAPDPTPGDRGGVAGVRAASVTLRKRASRAVVRPGRTVTFSLTATSTGAVPATGVRVCDRLPTAFTFVSLGGGRLMDNRRVCWDLGRLEGSRTVRLKVRAVTARRARRVTNVAVVTADGQRARRARARVRVPAGSGLPCPKGTSRRICRSPTAVPGP